MNIKAEAILGFDPGRDKCGIAVRDKNRELIYHQIIESKKAISTIERLITEYQVDLIVMGDKTTAKIWFDRFQSNLSVTTAIEMVDENNSTLEARDRYWKIYPPKGLTRLVPEGLRIPPRPVDDIVAILLIERYLSKLSMSQ